MTMATKPKSARATKRDLFAEVSEGMVALAEHRAGKRTLRTHGIEYKPAPKVTPRELVRVREQLNLSRALFAIYLRTNVRTLENWEQGRAKPNASLPRRNAHSRSSCCAGGCAAAGADSWPRSRASTRWSKASTRCADWTCPTSASSRAIPASSLSTR